MSIAKSTRPQADLQALSTLFYPTPRDLGQFVPVDASDMPPDYRRLLDHDGHMTETVEAFHQSPVDVTVLEKHVTPTHYARKILLVRRRDRAVVQFGIMRVAFVALDAEVRQKIEAESLPLGRILISHGVMRQVRLSQLYRVIPGADLRKLLDADEHRVTYGRTATIQLNERPAIELLEIVSPL